MFYTWVIDNENISRGIFEDERKKEGKKHCLQKSRTRADISTGTAGAERQRNNILKF